MPAHTLNQDTERYFRQAPSPTPHLIEHAAQILVETATFKPLGKTTCVELVMHGRERKIIKKGQRFWSVGKGPNYLGLILDGRVEVRRGPIVLRRLEHEIVGITSTVVDVPYSADLAAAPDTDVRLFLIPAMNVKQLMVRQPLLAESIIGRLADRMKDLTDEIEDLRRLTSKQRLAKRLLQLRRQDGGFNQVDIGSATTFAELVGMTANKLSTALADFAKRNLIKVKRDKGGTTIEILDPDELEDIASGA